MVHNIGVLTSVQAERVRALGLVGDLLPNKWSISDSLCRLIIICQYET